MTKTTLSKQDRLAARALLRRDRLADVAMARRWKQICEDARSECGRADAEQRLATFCSIIEGFDIADEPSYKIFWKSFAAIARGLHSRGASAKILIAEMTQPHDFETARANVTKRTFVTFLRGHPKITNGDEINEIYGTIFQAVGKSVETQRHELTRSFALSMGAHLKPGLYSEAEIGEAMKRARLAIEMVQFCDLASMAAKIHAAL